MPPAYEVLLLNTAIPQIQAAQSGDTYVVPRDIAFNAGVTVGDASGDAFTINSSAVSTPNGLNFDSNTFVIDAANNRVGIGTPSPATALDVTGQITTRGSIGAFIAEPRDGSGVTWSIYNPTGDDLRFYGNSDDRLILTNAGNLGLGVTPSAWSSTWKAFQISNRSLAQTGAGAGDLTMVFNGYFDSTDSRWEFQGAGDYAARYSITGAGVHSWHISTAAGANANDPITFTQAMTLDASGNLVVGATSGNFNGNNQAISVSSAQSGTTTAGIDTRGYATSDATIGQVTFFNGSNLLALVSSARRGANNSGTLEFYTSNAGTVTERARITSGGYFKASNNGTYADSTGGYHEFYQTNNTDTVRVTSTSTAVSGAYGVYVDLTTDPNATDSFFLRCYGGANQRASIRSNGGLANYQSNNVDLSDIRTKTDISPLASYWNKIAALEIVTYKYKDQTHDDLNIGVIAQQVEQVAPEFVDPDGFGETPEDGVPLKTIYNKDLTFAAIKALQEAMARIEKLEAEVAALKGA